LFFSKFSQYFIFGFQINLPSSFGTEQYLLQVNLVSDEGEIVLFELVNHNGCIKAIDNIPKLLIAWCIADSFTKLVAK
jgi:hypothetical protein